MKTNVPVADADLPPAESAGTATYGDGNPSTLDGSLAVAVLHRESGEVLAEGFEAVTEYFEGLLRSVDDVDMAVIETLLDDERIAGQFEPTVTDDPDGTGQHPAEVPPGERLTWTGVLSVRLADEGTD